MQINPALLVTKTTDLLVQASELVDFVTELDIDIIDWKRTDTHTLSVTEALKNKIPVKLNFDLMMDHPREAIEELVYDHRVKNIILNPECKDDIGKLIDLIHHHRKRAGMSLNPDSEVEIIQPYIHDLDLIQIYTVEPGSQGNPFLPSRLDLVSNLRLYNYQGQISIDGGINLDTVLVIKQFPVNILSVGSYLSKASNPRNAYLLLKKVAESA